MCENLRIKRHKVFQDVAQRGKSSTGWFYGFKLHAIINHHGELLAIKVTPGNSDDRKGLLAIASDVFGKLYADKVKNLCQIEHTRHRSLMNFAVNLMAGIVAYCLQDVKPCVKLHHCRDAMSVT